MTEIYAIDTLRRAVSLSFVPVEWRHSMHGWRSLWIGISCVAACLEVSPLPRLQADEPSSAAVAAWVKEQIDDGRLIVEFYDSAKPPRPYPGWTDFEFRLEYRYEYVLELPKKKKGARLATAVIVPAFSMIDVPVKNRMKLPDSLDNSLWQETSLGKHELEHIRIGLHPRLPMLGRHLLKKLNRIERMIGKSEETTSLWVGAQVNAEVAPRRDAIQTLVTNINRKFDTVTKHGTSPMPNFEEFLDGLFLKENLDEMKFSYLSEVLDLLSTKEYQDAKFVIREVDKKPPTPE